MSIFSRSRQASAPVAVPVAPRRTTNDVRRQRACVALAISVVLGAGSAWVLVGPQADPVAAAAASNGDVVDDGHRNEIVGLLDEKYYRGIDRAALQKTAVADLPRVLDDPYTHYLDPAGLARIQQADDGRYAGIGIHARLVDTAVVIDRVSPGSPAAAAGLRPDDHVVSADGTPVGGSDLEVALTPVRGPIGTVAHLTLQRGTTRFSADIRRVEVAAQLVQHELRTVGGTAIGYVQVLDFGTGVGEQVRQAVRDFDAQGVREVVLDLRRNGGGLVREAVAVASVFVPDGTPVLTESGQHFPTTTYRTHLVPTDTRTPLVVLVDGDTASAAEIVTGALRDASRARVVGTRTFGKGVVQDIAPLEGGGALKFTMAEYLTPSGRQVNRHGIVPDVEVAPALVEGQTPIDVAASAVTTPSRNPR